MEMKLTVSFLLSSLTLSGGVNVVIEYANRLAQRGHKIYFVVPGRTVDETIIKNVHPTIQIIETPFVKDLKTLNLFDKGYMSWSMAKITPPSDVIITTHTPTTFPGLLAKILLQPSSFLVWFFQDYKEMFKRKSVESWLLKHALKWHDLGLTISQYSYNQINSHSQKKVVIVGEGISTWCEPILKANTTTLATEHQIKKIMYLGDSRPRKGLTDFLTAAEIVFARNKHIHLVIVSKEILTLHTQIPYTFVLNPSNDELASLYKACDLFVSTSWAEGFGLPPLEAMACGVPVVLTDSGGVREYAVNEHNCLMVPPKSPELLAKGIEQILSDTELARKLAQNGPATAQKFTWETAVDRFENAILQLVSTKKRQNKINV
jgi:glycosyltransferase involved in cell wall biosynthesis